MIPLSVLMDFFGKIEYTIQYQTDCGEKVRKRAEGSGSVLRRQAFFKGAGVSL